MAASTVAWGQSSHLSGFSQLTHGGQNAEAYWSPDGKRLIFQTTRPPYDCDQIFIMNADGTDQHLVSAFEIGGDGVLSKGGRRGGEQGERKQQSGQTAHAPQYTGSLHL